MTTVAADAAARARVDILGVGIDPLDLEATCARIERALRERERTFVITANPEFVMLARRRASLRALAASAALVVPDGTGLVVASWLLGRAFPGRARGRDVVPRLAAIAARLDRSLYLLGAREGVAARAAAALQRTVPRLRVAGTHAGSPEPREEADIVARVNAATPDALLVAYGMPWQEEWIARNLPKLPSVSVAIGVGGVFDQLAGEVRLPPEWLAGLGLEWLWRLAQQPWRWRRQIALPAFLLLVLRERLRS